MSSQNGHVTSSVSNHIGTVTFFHPASNSLPGAILNELANSITAVAANPEVRVLILQSEGNKAFCAGASFDELIAIENMDQGSVFFSGFAKVINAMRTCGKLIIARVQGKAVGGGVGLASAADYVFATEQAAIKLSELAVGIGPFVVGPAVQRKMGLSAFSKMALTPAEWQTAEWAKEKGLYMEVFDTQGNSIQSLHCALLDQTDISNLLPSVVLGDANQKAKLIWTSTQLKWLDTPLSAKYQASIALNAFNNKQFEDVAYCSPIYLKGANGVLL